LITQTHLYLARVLIRLGIEPFTCEVAATAATTTTTTTIDDDAITANDDDGDHVETVCLRQ
jgi:hypothetical protein